MPAHSARSIGRLAPLLDAFGWAFCGAWALATLGFPLVKGMPAGYLPVLAGAGLGGLVWRSRAGLGRYVEGLKPGAYLWLVLGAAVVLRAAAVAYFPLEPMVDDAQFHRYAVAMVHGGGYGAPGVRAWFPPGMSLVLAGWYFVTTPSPLAGKILQIGFSALLVWQTWATVRQFLPERVARLAALLVAVSPTLVFYTATLGYEILLALVLLLSCRLAFRVTTVHASSVPTLLAIGALLGCGALLKPICLLLPVLFAVAWWLIDGSLLRAAGRAALVVVVMLLVISPWTLRNYRVLHAFVPISTNGGTTLYSANNPRATGLAMPVEPLPGESDEVSRDRLRMKAAVAWILGHPAASFQLALAKASYTWGASSSIMSVVSTDRLPPAVESACKALLNLTWTALLVWCIAATATGRPWSQPGMVPATLVVAYVFGLHLFYEAHSRHHVPVVPLLCIVAATSLAAAPAGRRD
ncbi:MAG: glycosyltransferase family 39 protein [Acidobacteriota bacterium]